MREYLHVGFDGRSLAGLSLRGWDRYTLGLVRELTLERVKVTFFGRAVQPIRAEHLQGLSCQVEHLDDRGGLDWTQHVLPRALHRHRCDLYHAPAEQGVPLIAPCPVVLTVHSVISYGYAELVRQGELSGKLSDYLGYQLRPWSFATLYWRAQIARAHAILAPSEYCRKEIIKHLELPAEQVHTTLLGLPEVFRRPAKSTAERALALRGWRLHRPYLLSVGGYEQHKNPHGLLAAFALFSALRQDVDLVMVGSRGVPEALRQLAAKLGIADRVTFLHDLGDDLVDLYDGAALFVSMSWLETFCLPALEAMSRGVVPVCSKWGALPEVVGKGGWLVDPRDHAAAAQAWTKALEDVAQGQRRQQVQEHAAGFAWRRSALTTLKVYQNLLSK